MLTQTWLTAIHLTVRATLSQHSRPSLCEMLAEYGWKPHRICVASNNNLYSTECLMYEAITCRLLSHDMIWCGMI